MKPSLQVRLSQHLALTPQLQQSIRLLQLSTLELHQEVEQMLEQNPFLEAEEESGSRPEPLTERLSASERAGEREAERAVDTAHDATDDVPAVDSAEFGTTERDDWENGTERDDFDGIRETPSLGPGSSGSDDDDFEPRERDQEGVTLAEHLRRQVVGMRLSAEDVAAVHVLIDSLTDDGYLADSLEEISAGLVEGVEAREELLDRLRCALKWLQAMEPIGVGARDLSECLCLQLRTLTRCEAQAIAVIVCKCHLELLARRDL